MLLNAKGKLASQNKPRGRAFGKGPDNPANHRSHQPKNNANSLVSLLDENAEIVGVSETGCQAYSVEQEKVQGRNL